MKRFTLLPSVFLLCGQLNQTYAAAAGAESFSSRPSLRPPAVAAPERFSVEELTLLAADPVGSTLNDLGLTSAKLELVLLHAPTRTGPPSNRAAGVISPERYERLNRFMYRFSIEDLHTDQAAAVLDALVDGRGPKGRISSRFISETELSGWDAFFRINDKSGLRLADGSVLGNWVHMRGLRKTIEDSFPHYRQLTSTYLQGSIILPPVEELNEFTLHRSGFTLLFPQRMQPWQVTSDQYLMMLANKTYPILDRHDLTGHWRKLLESDANHVADIARTAVALNPSVLNSDPLRNRAIETFKEQVSILLHHYLTPIDGLLWSQFVIDLRDGLNTYPLWNQLFQGDKKIQALRRALHDWLVQQGSFGQEFSELLK
jgi:hypothetical protein